MQMYLPFIGEIILLGTQGLSGKKKSVELSINGIQNPYYGTVTKQIAIQSLFR